MLKPVNGQTVVCLSSYNKHQVQRVQALELSFILLICCSDYQEDATG